MTLISLPTEMMEGIASHLHLTDYRSLRLVCSSLNQQSLHQFRERFFRQWTLDWTPERFLVLLDITQHPHFGTVLQSLIIDATPSFAIEMWQRTRQIAESHRSDVETCLKDEALSVFKRQEERAKFWTETRFDQKSLITIFKCIGSLGSISFAYRGMDKSFGKFSRKYCEMCQNEMSRPFVVTMSALAASGIAVGRIVMDGERRYGAISIGRLETLAPNLSKFDGAFESLTALELNLRDWRHNEGFELPEGRTPFVIRFLAKCKNVRRLQLSCFSTLHGNLMSEMAKHCTYPYMEHCHLELFRLSSIDHLFDFLNPATCSLRGLALSHIVLQDETATWPDVLGRIAAELRLVHLEIHNLFSHMGSRVGIEGTLKGSIVLSEPDLKSKVEYHAQHLTSGNWGPAWYLAPVAYPFIGMRT